MVKLIAETFSIFLVEPFESFNLTYFLLKFHKAIYSRIKSPILYSNTNLKFYGITKNILACSLEATPSIYETTPLIFDTTLLFPIRMQL